MARKIKGLMMEQQGGVFPSGPYEAWATPDGTRSAIMKFNNDQCQWEVVKTFRGESAWSDAEREAGDKNREAKK